ncbi:glutathione S-transferase N-terminal domain-containing protein [Piscinibacter sakaiensis]|uniref:glutathione S-transferase N-terminal domain-containing protein n=1 Tax=Piscinibacter sakaiensis TaxID=1547922 RepID=UPI003AADE54F
MRQAISRQARLLSSTLLSTMDLWRGTMLLPTVRRPKKKLKLYDLEGSTACRQVREVLTALGLDAVVLPCPIGGKRFRPTAEALLGDGEDLPLLVDADAGVRVSGAAPVIEHLFRRYAGTAPPRAYQAGAVSARLAALGSLLRGGRGIDARPARRPRRRLVLWSFESSPYSRLVRERLTELELAYQLHNVGKEAVGELGPAAQRLSPGPYRPEPGGRRAEMFERTGRVQLPYLEDPNTGEALFESDAIIDYLEHHYALSPQTAG